MGTISDAIAERLAARGVRRMFGVPGGDCNLDIIESAERVGIPFILTRNENAAGIMAAVTAEITGAPGVVMTTRGPGVTNATNGIAYADLDRAPVLMIADAYERELDPITHQRMDQKAVLAPLTRGALDLYGPDPVGDLDRLLDRACSYPKGPVYLEIVGSVVREPAPPSDGVRAPDTAPTLDKAALETARKLLAKAKRPAIIAGLQSTDRAAVAALRKLVAAWKCPVFTTYKAKGVASDLDPHTIGHYIGGASEVPAISEADLLLLYGFDPVEHPPGKWRFSAPIIDVVRHSFDRHVIAPQARLIGDLAAAAAALQGAVTAHEWTPAKLDAMRKALRARADAGADAPESGPIAPQHLVAAALKAAPEGARISIDAGAHMLSVLHMWPITEPFGSLFSRGLATMGFALPAAIASSLAEPDRPAIAFTGDGGLMMCLGELGTAVQNKCRVTTVVFNDSSLTLIGAKQRRRQLPNAGVDFSPANFAAIAEGFGCAAYRVETPDQLGPALRSALDQDGPALVDVVVNPHAYHEQIISIRG
ncbi:MAG: thiamine pyrophosphate-binding protein [Alphaproteobacteria bacterium]|nr:thiamine pyrophosphate-binding protein [Alphaproteobacteria bacterium]